MAKCYYPGCESHANSKEHIPPKSFFPDSKKTNLMTVKSCKLHNNEKTKNDLYALINICTNCIVEKKDDAVEVFETRVKPQLMHNNEALFKKVFSNLTKERYGYRFKVDRERLDSFFNCLTHGILYNKTKKKINPENYFLSHLYMNLDERNEDGSIHDEATRTKMFWAENFLGNSSIADILEFKTKSKNGYSEDVYKVKIIGADFLEAIKSDDLTSSITVIHEFYGHFVVVSLLTRVTAFENSFAHFEVKSI